MSRLTPEHEKDDSITLHMEHYRRLVESLNNVTKERDALRAIKTPPSVPHYTEERCQQLVRMNTALLAERDAALSRIEKLREALELYWDVKVPVDKGGVYAMLEQVAENALKADDEAAGK